MTQKEVMQALAAHGVAPSDMLAANEWVSSLREQAVKQREGGSSKPVL